MSLPFTTSASVTAAVATTATSATSATTATTATAATTFTPTVSVVTATAAATTATNNSKNSRTIFSGVSITSGATTRFSITNSYGGNSDKMAIVTLTTSTSAIADVQASLQAVEYYMGAYEILVKNTGAVTGAKTFAINIMILE